MMSHHHSLSHQELLRQNQELSRRLQEAEETLRAIREGEVDAIVVAGPQGDRIFSLSGAESVYRLIVQTMKEAALTVSPEGRILFSNAQFGAMIQTSLETLIGHPLKEFVEAPSYPELARIMVEGQAQSAKGRVVFKGAGGPVPAHVSASLLSQADGISICMVAADLSELEASTELIQELRRHQELLEQRTAELARTNEALRQSEDRLQMALQAGQLCPWDHDIEKNQGVWSECCKAMFGVASDQPMNLETFFSRVHPEDGSRVEQIMRESVGPQASGCFEGEFRIRRPDGAVRWIHSQGMTLFEGRGEHRRAIRRVGISKDITDRKQAEARLHRQTVLLTGINRIFQETLRYGSDRELGETCLGVALEVTESDFGMVGELGPDGRFNIIALSGSLHQMEWNSPPGPAQEGLPEDESALGELCGKILKDRFSPLTPDSGSSSGGWARSLEFPPATGLLGVPLMNHGQAVGLIAVGGRPEGYEVAEQECLKTLAATLMEALLRRRAEEALRKSHAELEQKVAERTADLYRINQLLRIILECNQALVKAVDERELVQEICRIITDLSGCRMAWVGYAGEDQDKTVRVIASVGFEDGCLDRLRISWGEESIGGDPTGAAIRTGQICTGFDDQTDPKLAAWHEAAVRNGFRSAMALPLTHQGWTFGALTVYSAQSEAFDPIQTTLLRELADDLAFGIVALRARLDRDLAQDKLKQRNSQLRALASQLTLAEERERRRMAKVLHDGLQQLLVGARFQLDALSMRSRGTLVEKELQGILDILHESLKISRSLTAELSPPILHEGGLMGGLKWLGRWFGEKFNLNVTMQLDPAGEVEAEDIRVTLFQAVRELLFNVVKHAGVNSAQVQVARAKDHFVQIVVSDGGAGFDPALLRAREGTAGGFGLFSLRERLELLGGCLAVESAPGQGSRFIIHAPISASQSTLPMNASGSPEPFRPADPLASSSPGSRIRVLIADDHPIVRNGLTMSLEDEPDIEVVGQAPDGQQVVELARQLRPDVILMDINMPVKNGIEATRLIAAEWPQVAIIGLTMFDDEQNNAAMLEAGAMAFMNKSGYSNEVVSLIRQCACARRKPSERSAASDRPPQNK